MSTAAGELTFTPIVPERADELAALEHLCYPTIAPDELYDASGFEQLAVRFPDGCFMALDGDMIVGAGTGILIDFDFAHTQHSLDEIAGPNGWETHSPDGDWYYGTTIITHPAHRGRGIGRRIYELRKQCVIDLGKAGIVAGGMLPGYAEHRSDMSAVAYVERVAAGDLYDATLTFQIENGFEVRGVIEDYLIDEAVGNCASLIVWPNPAR